MTKKKKILHLEIPTKKLRLLQAAKTMTTYKTEMANIHTHLLLPPYKRSMEVSPCPDLIRPPRTARIVLQVHFCCRNKTPTSCHKSEELVELPMKMLNHAEMQLLFMPLSYGLFSLKIAHRNRRRIRPTSLRTLSRLIFGTSSRLLCARKKINSCMILV
jgi:hypothetical protein